MFLGPRHRRSSARRPSAWLSIGIGALSLGTSFEAARASGPDEKLLERGQELLDDYRLDAARAAFEKALEAARSRPAKARAQDRLGAVDGIDARYWSAFVAFFKAARLGGTEAVASLEHPQAATRAVAQCAVRMMRASPDLAHAEQNLRSTNGIAPGSNLDTALASALFDDRFRCPDQTSAPPLPMPVESRLPMTDAQTATGAQTSRAGGGPPAATWLLGATALAAAGTGVGLGFWALDGLEQGQSLSSAEDRVLWANVAFGVAGAAAVAALIVWWIDAQKEGPKNLALAPPLLD